MDRRYQIFVSSTFSDLKDERAQIQRIILELNHIPAGMELFPATSGPPWELIKRVIDFSDYYLLIIAGRYGSVDEGGIGFTEREYDYAVSIDKPVFAFLHQNPDLIIRGKSELSSPGTELLAKFRKKVEGKLHCKYWLNVDQLVQQVSVAISHAEKHYPATGWVRGNSVSADVDRRIENLQTRSAILERENADLRSALTPRLPSAKSTTTESFVEKLSPRDRELLLWIARKDKVESITVAELQKDSRFGDVIPAIHSLAKREVFRSDAQDGRLVFTRDGWRIVEQLLEEKIVVLAIQWADAQGNVPFQTLSNLLQVEESMVHTAVSRLAGRGIVQMHMTGFLVSPEAKTMATRLKIEGWV
jgi:hypothetical protein